MKTIIGFFLMSFWLCISNAHAMTEMADRDLSEVTGQALFNMSKESDATQKLDFYKLSIDGELSLNANIKNLQLGCGGINNGTKGAGCDIDISELSFGCIAGVSGHCITLPGVAGQPLGKDANNALDNQKELRDFILTNPFFQFAIKGGDQASTREVVGVRVGAEHAEGPMSVGSMNSFSGYMTGINNLYIEAQKNIAVTCDGNGPNCSPSDASKFTNDFIIDGKNYTKANGYLGVKNGTVLGLDLLVTEISVEYKDQTIDTKAAERLGLKISASGNRLNQVNINGLILGNLVDEVVDGLTINQMCAGHDANKCSAIGTADIGNLLLPLLKTGIKIYMKQETIKGLDLNLPTQNSGETDANYSTRLTNILNNYVLPYNLNNVHQIDVNSSLFGIALTSLTNGIRFPGFAADAKATQGWSMYLEDAFTINIKQNLTTLMSNMVQNGNAAAGNITMLEPAYRNCFGNLKFC